MAYKQVIVVRVDLGMGKGKIAAQSAHASVEALEKAKIKEPGWVETWRNEGQEKVVLKIKDKKELLALFMEMKNLFPCALIKDAGRTQIQAGEATCFACGPAPEIELDKFTAKLPMSNPAEFCMINVN